MKRFALALLFAATAVAAADPSEKIQLKNGDVLRGSVIEQKIGQYVQVRLRDDSERRLKWDEIESISKDQSAATMQPNSIDEHGPKTPAVPEFSEHPELRYELDFRPYDFTTTWQNLSIKLNNSATTQKADIVTRLSRTVPPVIDLRIYLTHLTLNAQIDGNSTAGTFALGYALNRDFPRSEAGLNFAFNRSDVTATNSSNQVTRSLASDYTFGPYTRIAIKTSPLNFIELSLFTGIDIVSVNQESTLSGGQGSQLTGNGTTYFANGSITNVFTLTKGLALVTSVSGGSNGGTLSGGIGSGSTGQSGSGDFTRSFLTIVPAALRLRF